MISSCYLGSGFGLVRRYYSHFVLLHNFVLPQWQTTTEVRQLHTPVIRTIRTLFIFAICCRVVTVTLLLLEI